MTDVDDILRRALELGEDGDWEGMAQALAEALEDLPDDSYLLCWLGVAERELGLAGAAYDRFKQSLAQQPQDPYVLATAGAGLAAFDDPEAEAALRTAAMIAPDLAVARWSYGAYLSREGFLEHALRELEAAQELAPDEPTVWLEKGVALALKGDHDQAADALERAAELEPGDGWPRVLLGLALVELERIEDATGELARGARLRPQDAEAQLLTSLAAAAAGWEDLAAEMLERARQSAVGMELAVVLEAEEQIDEGTEAARDLLADVAPGAFRERLMVRP